MIPCKHWTECGFTDGGCCAQGHFGGMPGYGQCLELCADYTGPARGRGDLIKKLVTTVTLGLVRPCVPCKERQINQNTKHPAGWVEEALRA